MMNPLSETKLAISDKPTEQGHRAFYLGEHGQFPYDADGLSAIANESALSNGDREIFDLIIASLRTQGTLPFTWTPQEHFFITHNSQDKIVPYLIYRYKFRIFPKQRIVSDFPIHVLIEPTSACNLRCVMCFQTDRTFTKKSYMGMMDTDLFRHVIDQAADGGARAVSIGSRGEPYMHRHVGEMLRYASDKKAFFDLKINTNATRLGESDCHDILSSDVNLIALSVDAHEKLLYEEIRKRGNFDVVLENIRRLRRIRDTHYPDSKVEIRVSGVRFRDDQDEDGFHAFWSEICDTVVYVRAQARWDTYKNPRHLDKTDPCDFLWERLYVWHDGKTNPCDEDYKSALSPGCIHEKSIHEIWHGEAMTKLRKDHLSKRRCNHMPCDRCGV